MDVVVFYLDGTQDEFETHWPCSFDRIYQGALTMVDYSGNFWGFNFSQVRKIEARLQEKYR